MKFKLIEFITLRPPEYTYNNAVWLIMEAQAKYFRKFQEILKTLDIYHNVNHSIAISYEVWAREKN